jgi:uncharacterized membrane protein YccC
VAVNPVQMIRAAAFALGRELRAWQPSRERALFGARAVISVALAVVLADALHLSNVWWAAISGYVVAQSGFLDSSKRAAQRMLGTILGGCLGALVGPLIGNRPWLFIPALGLIGGVAVYHAYRSRPQYAWMLGGITALMVTYEAHVLGSTEATVAFAKLRVVEVAVGTLACVVVSGVFALGLRCYPRGSPASALAAAAVHVAAPLPVGTLNAASRILGIQGAVAMSILAAITDLLDLPGLMQGMVTVIAVLVLPETVLAKAGRSSVVEKMLHRLLGCLLAGAIGAPLLPLLHGQALACILVLSVGIWFGCHVQTGIQGATYVGRQFNIAFIMVFVQDHGWAADAVPALTRLAGILVGVVVLALVMLATLAVPVKFIDAAATNVNAPRATTDRPK